MNAPIVAEKRARGIMKAFTYYFWAYMLFATGPLFGYQEGIYGDSAWLVIIESSCILIMIYLAFPEFTAFFRVCVAIFQSDSEIQHGSISGQNDGSLSEWVFERPASIMVRQSGMKDPLNEWVDYPPQLLQNPAHVRGDSYIALGNRKLIADFSSISLIGFDRYQVSHYPEMVTKTPHILIRMRMGQPILAIGKFSISRRSIRLQSSSTMLLIDKSQLNNFLFLNMARLIFLAGAMVLTGLRIA